MPDDDLLDHLSVDVRGLFPLNSHNDRVPDRIRRVPKGDPRTQAVAKRSKRSSMSGA